MSKLALFRHLLLGALPYVWRGQEQTIGQVTCWKSKSKKPLGRPKQRWIDRVHKDLDMLGILNGEELATNRDR